LGEKNIIFSHTYVSMQVSEGIPINQEVIMKNLIPGTVSLLYVEDDADTRDLVTKMLKKNGFNCLVAENGREGLELYRRHLPEVVLSDIMMPVMSGLEMARSIRADFPEAQFIFMTALGESKFILEAIDIGVSRYVVKPVELSKLLAAISQCVAVLRLKAEAHRVKHLETINILAGGLAHDFNNLFQVVIGHVGLAKKRVEQGCTAHMHLEMAEGISRDARHLGKLLGTLARGESGRRQRLPLAPTIRYSVEAALSGTSVTPTFDLPPDLPLVAFDKTQMEQVVSHLTVNAIEAMPQGGTLEIATLIRSIPLESSLLLSPGEYVQITFSDTGKGIPPGNLARIFDPYFTTKDMDFNKGRGLGLSICHSIVSMHGGQINAYNSPDAGATFNIWLPIAGNTDEENCPSCQNAS
jgi:signal transduction histidine kinase